MASFGKLFSGGHRILERVVALPDAAGVAAFLLVFAFFGYSSLRDDSVTSDELAHLPAGFTYLDRLDFRLNPEHPPLAKMWAALPIWLAALRRPDYNSVAWQRRDEWAFGLDFLHGRHADGRRVDPMNLLIPGRLAIVVLGMILGWAMFQVGRELLGRRAAYIALFFYVLSPTLLAHARLVTTDLPAALGFFLSVWTFRRFLKRPGVATTLAAGGALGVALLFKFSTVVLGPIMLILAGLWVVEGGIERSARKVRIRNAIAGLSGILGVAWLCVWAGYGFRFEASGPGGSQFIDEGSGLLGMARNLRLAPEAYLLGLRTVSQSLTREAYLNGEIGSGWWYYFPVAFLLKTTPVSWTLGEF